jgi:hypothetical protein
VSDFLIVTPSRGRVARFSPLLKAAGVTVCVAEAEADSYRTLGLPLITHPGTGSIGVIRQAILDQVEACCVVMVDDDLKGIRPMVGKSRKLITDADRLLAIVANSVQVCEDLGIHLFAWSRNPNAAYFRAFDPMNLVAPLAGAFGVIGRDYRFADLSRGEDLDLTLQGLLKDRVVFIDNRYYFDFGKVGSGAGGLQGVRSDARRERDSAYLRRKWGDAVRIGQNIRMGAGGKPNRNFERFGINVRRR